MLWANGIGHELITIAGYEMIDLVYVVMDR